MKTIKLIKIAFENLYLSAWFDKNFWNYLTDEMKEMYDELLYHMREHKII